MSSHSAICDMCTKELSNRTYDSMGPDNRLEGLKADFEYSSKHLREFQRRSKLQGLKRHEKRDLSNSIALLKYIIGELKREISESSGKAENKKTFTGRIEKQ